MSHAAWSVCLCVCLFVCLSRGWARDAVWGPTRMRSRNHVLDGVQILTGRGNFGGCSAHWKALGVSATVYAAKGITQSSITARQRHCCSRLQCSRLGRRHVTLSPWKIRPRAMRLFVKKIFDRLFFDVRVFSNSRYITQTNRHFERNFIIRHRPT